MFKKIEGGIEVAGGVFSAGVHAGIKKSAKDLALIYIPEGATTTGVFTKNRVYSHHVKYCRQQLDNFEKFKAIIINSGNANALNGVEGFGDIERIVHNVAGQLDIEDDEVLMASTGVIGERLILKTMEGGFEQAISELTDQDSRSAAEAILTTDSTIKQVAYESTIAGQKVRIGAMVKGTRMIHPNMGTMIGVITTNLSMSQSLLKRQLILAVDESFNKMTIDGNTSPNDTVFCLSTNEVELELSRDVLSHFQDLLLQVCHDLSYMIVADAERATKTIEVEVNQALTKSDATKIAREIALASLVKRSMYENFPDTGRIMAACGSNPEVTMIPHLISIDIESEKGRVRICENGQNVIYNMKEGKNILDCPDVKISMDLNIGEASSTVWTCDFASSDSVN